MFSLIPKKVLSFKETLCLLSQSWRMGWQVSSGRVATTPSPAFLVERCMKTKAELEVMFGSRSGKESKCCKQGSWGLTATFDDDQKNRSYVILGRNECKRDGRKKARPPFCTQPVCPKRKPLLVATTDNAVWKNRGTCQRLAALHQLLLLGRNSFQNYDLTSAFNTRNSKRIKTEGTTMASDIRL